MEVLSHSGANYMTVRGDGQISVGNTSLGSTIPLVVQGGATGTTMKLLPGASNVVGIQMLDPGTNATQLRLNTNNTSVVMQALGGAGTTLNFTTQNASNIIVLNNGVVVGGATGGDQGVGTINASAYFVAGLGVPYHGTSGMTGGKITVQSGGTASGGAAGDIFLIY